MSDFIELTRVDDRTVAIRHANIDSIEVDYWSGKKVSIVQRRCAGLPEVICKETVAAIVKIINAAQKADD